MRKSWYQKPRDMVVWTLIGPVTRIEFLPDGETKKARDNAKGHLLESLIGDFLRASNYTDLQLAVRVDGTEWDVVGKAALSQAPVLVSCKCLSASISPEPLKSLAFDVMNLAEEIPTASGVLVAIPKISEDTKIYWSKVNSKMQSRVRILNETELLADLSRQPDWSSPEVLRALTSERHKTVAGDSRLLYTDRGAYWMQLVVREGIDGPEGYYICSTDGTEISDPQALSYLEYLIHLNESALREATCLNRASVVGQSKAHVEIPQAHLTSPGVGWFDYKHPAPPECCVGRDTEVGKFVDFVQNVAMQKTASRVCITTGPSGIGKSSLVLKMCEAAKKVGGRYVAINSISAKGKAFVLAAVRKLIQQLARDVECASLVADISITGFDSLPEVVQTVGERLATKGLIPIIIFDQFETALLDGPLAESLVEFVLAMEERRANVVVGFAWKTDLWWPDDHVPYSARETIRKHALPIQIDQFGPTETNVLIKALAKEVGRPLLPSLFNEIRLFSRGYPWLLKKVCWHVLEQAKQGVGVKRGKGHTSLGDRIAALREKEGLTLVQLSERTGLAQNYLDLLESGSATNPTIESLAKISRALGVSMYTLLGEDQTFLEMRLDLRALFEEDLNQLGEHEKELLKKLAAILPTDGRTIAETFPEVHAADLLNKFVGLHLILCQGDTYNIYHDIFKEFLRTGRVPIEESYLLRMSPAKALDFVGLLADSGGSLDVEALADAAKIQVASAYNYIKDLSLIGLTTLHRGKVSLHKDVQHIQTQHEFILETRRRLVRNVCARQILALVNEGRQLSAGDVIDILKREFPSLSAKHETWRIYASTMVAWLNQVKAAGHAPIRLSQRATGRRLVGAETTAEYPEGQVSGVVRLIELLDAKGQLKKTEIASALGKNLKTIEKALVDVRLLGMCERLLDGRWKLTPLGTQFAHAGDTKRRETFREAMLNVNFIKQVLGKMGAPNRPDARIVIGSLLEERRGRSLSVSSVQTVANVIKNWCGYAGIDLALQG
jgi:transcriptional regulator with XRE-family HTH domain